MQPRERTTYKQTACNRAEPDDVAQVSNTETDMENKKLRMKELTDGALLKSVNDAQAPDCP